MFFLMLIIYELKLSPRSQTVVIKAFSKILLAGSDIVTRCPSQVVFLLSAPVLPFHWVVVYNKKGSGYVF